MLQDPENFQEFTIVVRAKNEAEARTKAEVEAEKLCDAKTIAVSIGCQRKTKSGKFVCTLRIETRP
ncbi:hypothetical protein BST81_16805 [Leptolyngbya sp. 'hensonii']|nr:hypothetical protein BST81_16805 [Leptolyngbya sp. 'hensonii']